MMRRFILILALLWLNTISSQDIKGTILDKATNLPLESVSVYFDNTTIGTASDEEGNFSIDYNSAIKSPLVFSMIGYKKVFITDYEPNKFYKIYLEESAESLNEVLISYDDGLTRRQKLRLFRKQFLGFSKFAASCKILNEDDLVLRFDKDENILTVSSKNPVLIENKKLNYLIEYEIVDFEISYHYFDLSDLSHKIKSVIYTGTSFYKDLEENNNRKTDKLRKKAYKGSVQHFMRCLYEANLDKEGYQIFRKGFIVNPWDHINIVEVPNSDLKKVTVTDKLVILFNKKDQTTMEVKGGVFYIDKYGNHIPIPNVIFTGKMGDQRMGDALPTDFNLNKAN